MLFFKTILAVISAAPLFVSSAPTTNELAMRQIASGCGFVTDVTVPSLNNGNPIAIGRCLCTDVLDVLDTSKFPLVPTLVTFPFINALRVRIANSERCQPVVSDTVGSIVALLNGILTPLLNAVGSVVGGLTGGGSAPSFPIPGARLA